ncbi:MAG: NADH-quinone oxidoreductase subunit F [Gammaproteobacteria bacterium]|nr:NADH-quinone oxidoreductase subunit F [Gammaproteobacteria bacterium]
MVNPIYLIASALAAAFFIGVLPDRWRRTAYILTLATLGFMSTLAAGLVYGFAWTGAVPMEIHTAGTPPPFAISLYVGVAEASGLLLVSLTGLLAALTMHNTLLEHGRRAMAVLLIFVMAMAGIILTRDLFNLFVFFELTVISTGGLILLSRDQRALGAGFKYLLASQLISILFLVGLIFSYHATGTMNVDGMAAQSETLFKTGFLAFFLMFIAVIIELKPVPANGWALDIYESAHPAVSALFSAAAASAALFAVDKLLLIGGMPSSSIVTVIGIVSFVVANILALSQTTARRLLGYSSVAQTGLILAVLGQKALLGDNYLFVAGGLLLAHAVSKAGLFWLSGLLEGRELTDWAALRGRPWLIVAFASFIAMLTGLPPFPGFYAKWELVHTLAASGGLILMGLILFGALIEAAYLFRWFGYAIKREQPDVNALSYSLPKTIVTGLAVIAAWCLGFVWGELSGNSNQLFAIPLLFALSFLLLEWAPAWLKNTLAIAGMLSWFALNYSGYDPLQMIFQAIILIGGPLILLASYHEHGRRIGFYPSAMLMYAGLTLLISAEDSFNFFAAWEALTVGSYFLIMRGKKSEPHALSYIVFSLGGAFLILAGFAIAAQGAPVFPLAELGKVTDTLAPWVFALLAIGFMTKTAAIGVHIWLPGAHAEAETDVSPMVSGILLKAGLFGLFMLVLNMGRQQLFGIELTHVMMWIGALSALLGNLLAAFQEDAKRLLAYSSIGQMGYALFGLSMMNHLGFLMALMFVINHYIYKSMLFLSVGGVAKRTGTREMYRMGGLISLMPLTFVAVLVGIIAVSGVPPLSGFGGRWIFYNAILTADYRLPMILIFLSGPIAFLYLFRLIHTIFLGQLKDEHRKLKEAPFWIVLPQMIYVLFLVGFAIVPGLALRRVDGWISRFYPEHALAWDGFAVTSDFGYWQPVSIMLVIAVLFVTLFLWLLLINRKAQKVKQFNIVFAAERPYRPETTHFAYNFFAPYRRAMGFMTEPYVTRFWSAQADLLHGVSGFLRRFYTGNGQLYAIYLLAFVIVVYLMQAGF